MLGSVVRLGSVQDCGTNGWDQSVQKAVVSAGSTGQNAVDHSNVMFSLMASSLPACLQLTTWSARSVPYLNPKGAGDKPTLTAV
eukprot:1152897-Pelagomonas_calceolata.AAC.1